MLSRGNDCKAQLSAILPIDRDRKREKAREGEDVREIGERVDKRENEGESKADNSTKLRTGRWQRLRHAAN